LESHTVESCHPLPIRNALVDAEVVVDGNPDFSLLAAALGARERPGHKVPHELSG
jgi:hypothetical protein